MDIPSKRLIGIDVLRAIAIISVIASHWRASRIPELSGDWLDGLARALSGFGGYGVILFFVISGFIITRTTAQRDGEISRMRVGSFYLRRAARIGPAWVLALTFGIAALLTADRSAPAAVFTLLGNAPFTAAFWLSIVTFTFNLERSITILGGHDWGLHWGVLWSLSVEEQFYVLFPLLVRRARNRKSLYAILAVLMFTGVATRLAIRHWPPAVWVFPTPACVDALAIGVAAAMAPDLRLPRRWAWWGGMCGFFILAIGFLCATRIEKPIIIGVGAAMIFLSAQGGLIFTSCFWLPLARVGRVSYGMYLFHPLVLYCLSPILYGMTFLPGLAVIVAGSIIIAEISFRLVEQPVGRWIVQHWSPPTASRSGSHPFSMAPPSANKRGSKIIDYLRSQMR